MTRRRWIADEVSENSAALTGEHADHLIRVLRARVGQEFDIVTNRIAHRGRITRIQEGRVEFELGKEIPTVRTIPLTLVLAIFRFERMEWAIEKCTELGVSRIVPLLAHRTDRHLAGAAVKRVERWQRIAHEASEQSRRGDAPELARPLRLKDAVALPGAARIVLAEAEDQLSLKKALQLHRAAGELLLAIGPEGGWTKDEHELFRRSGWISASLGPTILRVETAAIVAVAVAVAELQDSRDRL